MLEQRKNKRVILNVSSLPSVGESKYIYHNTTDGFFYYWNDVTGKYIKIKNLDVLNTIQPTPTSTGNTTNLNCTFKDSTGKTWIIDDNGDAINTGSSLVGDRYKTSSTTCNNIVNNSELTFTIETGLSYSPLQDVLIYHNSTNYMNGSVVSYDAVTGVLVALIQSKTGSGNYCSWNINLDGIAITPETVTTIYDTVTGHKIAQYSNENEVVIDINETITSIGTITYNNTSGLLTIPYTDENGTVNSKTVTITPVAFTEWYLANTTTDAGNNKATAIYRIPNVGFGLTDPKEKVDVNGTILVRSGNDSFVYTKNQVLFGYNTNNNYQHAIKTRHSATNQNGNAVDFFLWYQGTDVSTTVGTRNVMTIMGNGAVGINNNAPTVPIDVNAIGNAPFLPVARFLGPSNNIAGNNTQLIFGTAQASGNCADWRFLYAGNGSASNRVDFGMSGRVTPMISYLYNGNVGINHSTPLSSLDVNGSFAAIIRSSAVSITTSGDHTIFMTTGNTTCTLEAPTNVTRRIMVIKNTSTGIVTVSGHIDGTTSNTHRLVPKESVMVQSDGVTWQIIARYNSPSPIAVSANLNPVNIPSGVVTAMTTYTNVSDTSNGAWNNTTGTFTCNKAGLYRFEFRAMFASSFWTQSQEINAMFYKNGVSIQNASWFISSSYTQYAFSGHNFLNLNLAVGDTFQVRIWHNGGSTKTTYIASYSTLLINEIR